MIIKNVKIRKDPDSGFSVGRIWTRFFSIKLKSKLSRMQVMEWETFSFRYPDLERLVPMKFAGLLIVITLVLIWEGNMLNMLRTYAGKKVFSEEKIN